MTANPIIRLLSHEVKDLAKAAAKQKNYGHKSYGMKNDEEVYVSVAKSVFFLCKVSGFFKTLL